MGGGQGEAMAFVRFQYITKDRDRHGNVRFYFRRPGKPKIRLRGLPGSEEFLSAYKAAFTGRAGRAGQSRKELRLALRALLQVGVFQSLEDYTTAAQADGARRDIVTPGRGRAAAWLRSICRA